MAELGEQFSGKVTDRVKTVSGNVMDCRNQILAEKESSLLKFQKVNQKIEIMKSRLASKQASENLSAAEGNTEQNQVANVNSASQANVTPSGSMSEVNASHNVSTCIDVADVELSDVNNTAVVNATSEMPINRVSFVDCNKQSVVTFMRDLDLYFELKKIPENLKLPLVLRAIKDSFAQNWVSSEYHKIDSYRSFKSQFSQLFWNELNQSRVRCDIFQGKYDRNGGESMTEH
jgi:hypothetical protein